MSESPSPPAPTENHGAAPAEKHGAACGQLHCAVCTAHLAHASQRYCSARCRSRARSLRKQEMVCTRCGSRQWQPRRQTRLP